MSTAPDRPSILRGGLLISLAQAVKVVAQFGAIIVLSRLLVPNDFGLYASLSPLLALVAVFQNLGLSQAVVQRPTLDQGWLDRVFWTSVAMAVTTSALVLLLAPAVGAFYGEPRLRALTAVSAVTVFVSTLGTVPSGLLNRDMRFSVIARIDIVSTLAGVVAGVVVAAASRSYWALLVSPLVMATLNLAQSAAAAAYRPHESPTLLKREEIGFGAHLTGFNFLNYFARNLDNVLIGRVLGPVPLGHYDRAYKLLLFPLQNIIAPISRVMVPALSRVQEHPEQLRAQYLKAVRPLALITIPGVAAGAVVSEPLVQLLFGPGWEPAAPILAALCIAGCNQPISSTTGWLFVARGAGQTLLRWGVYSTVTTILAFIVGLPYGAAGVALAYAASDWLLRVPALYYLVHRTTPVRARDLVVVQLPLAMAGIATYGVERTVRGIVELSPLVHCALVAGLSYTLGIVCLAALPEGRTTLATTGTLLRRLFGAQPH